MRDRLLALKRLSAMYEMVEEMRLIETRHATAAAMQAREAVLAEETRTLEARLGGREALLTDDRMGWSLAVAREEIAEMRRCQLEPILEEREERSEEIRRSYLASRLWSERMKSLVASAEERTLADKERRIQASADDRFLARRFWLQRSRGKIGDVAR